MEIQSSDQGPVLLMQTANELDALRFAAAVYRGDLPRLRRSSFATRRGLLELASAASQGCIELMNDPSNTHRFTNGQTYLGIEAARWTIAHPRSFVTPEMTLHLTDLAQVQEAEIS